MSVNNAKAVIEALLGYDTPFTRTPKYRVEAAGDDWKQRRYRVSVPFVPYVELALGLYCTVMAAYAVSNGLFGTLPFIVLFQLGFFYAAGLSLAQSGERAPLVAEQEALAEE